MSRNQLQVVSRRISPGGGSTYESSRPDPAPEATSRCQPTFQFPKSLILPFIRPFIRLSDAGWLPAAQLKQHVVICGFPRSGTTLCQLMVESCVTGIRIFGRERRALEVAQFGHRSHPSVVTKRPKDVFLINEIREFYRSHAANVRFILMNRDPRAVLTSIHFSKPSEYFVSVNTWRHIYAHWKWARDSADVIDVRYEDLISSPDDVEHRVSEFTGWNVTRPFRRFHESVPGGFDIRALNGLRELDSGNLTRWQDNCHFRRIRSLLSEMPELPEILVELGYEHDDSWTREFMHPRRPAATTLAAASTGPEPAGNV